MPEPTPPQGAEPADILALRDISATTGSLAQEIARIAWTCIKECRDHDLPLVMCVKHQLQAQDVLTSAVIRSPAPREQENRQMPLREGADSVDRESSRTAATAGESFIRAIQQIRDTYAVTAKAARHTDAGTDSYWELSGYVHLLDAALKNARIHRKRAEGIDRQIEARR